MAKTGERKAQILQTLAAMLEDPKGERITTALLAARLEPLDQLRTWTL